MVQNRETLAKSYDAGRAGVPPPAANGDGTHHSSDRFAAASLVDMSPLGFAGTSPHAVRLFPSPHRPGFTLVEVVVAMAVLATISAGLLATSWRLTDFARDEAEHMVADAYCHDVTWAIYSQSYSDMLAEVQGETVTSAGKLRSLTWEIIANPDVVKVQAVEPITAGKIESLRRNLKELPWVETVNFFGKKSVTIPLWRTLDTAKVPECTAQVLETPTNKVITVSVSWWKDGAVKVGHSNVVTRANVERKI